MLPRILEPEVMDTPQEAVDYDAMDHSGVNRVFVDDFLNAVRTKKVSGTVSVSPLRILDAGTGTAQIPIELCSRRPFPLQVVATDLAGEMLKVAERNVVAAGFVAEAASFGAEAGSFCHVGFEAVITLQRVDCKSLPEADGSFDAVISNSIVHHIPQPRNVLAELWRVLKPGGVFFIRDLLRPPDAATLDRLVATYAGEENAHQQQMFRDSLHAALTLDELRGLLADVGIPPAAASRTTDRHWTLSAIRS